MPTCPYYQEFYPAYLNVTNDLCGDINVGQYDVEKNTSIITLKYIELSGQLDISSVPALYLFKDDGNVYKYDGERNEEDVVEFAREGYKHEDNDGSSLYAISVLLFSLLLMIII